MPPTRAGPVRRQRIRLLLSAMLAVCALPAEGARYPVYSVPVMIERSDWIFTARVVRQQSFSTGFVGDGYTHYTVRVLHVLRGDPPGLAVITGPAGLPENPSKVFVFFAERGDKTAFGVDGMLSASGIRPLKEFTEIRKLVEKKQVAK